MNGEDLPAATNTVSLDASKKDAHGLPVAHLRIGDHANDLAMRGHFLKQARSLLVAFGRSHVIANLFVSDGSQFVSASAQNPTLTIVALALRQARHLGDLMTRREV